MDISRKCLLVINRACRKFSFLPSEASTDLNEYSITTDKDSLLHS